MKRLIIALLAISLPGGTIVRAAPQIALEELIDSVLTVQQAQFDYIDDMIFDAALYEKKTDKKGKVKEVKKYEKKIYLKKAGDTLLCYEDFLVFYKNGERQPNGKLDDEERKKKGEKKKRGGRDLTFDFIRALKPSHRELFDITYEGIAAGEINGFRCHTIRATAREQDRDLMDYIYYIDTASYHLVRVDFEPSKLGGGLMFKLKGLQMSMSYEPYNDLIWMPYRFNLIGKGKAALFIGVYFQFEELYSNPVINSGLDDSLFIETASED